MINDHNQLQKKNSKDELHPVGTELHMFAEQNIIMQSCEIIQAKE